MTKLLCLLFRMRYKKQLEYQGFRKNLPLLQLKKSGKYFYIHVGDGYYLRTKQRNYYDKTKLGSGL